MNVYVSSFQVKQTLLFISLLVVKDLATFWTNGRNIPVKILPPAHPESGNINDDV